MKGSGYFGGLFEYDGTEYALANTQLSATSDYVYKQNFYGKDGVLTGTLGDTVATTFDDISNAVYGKAQAKYDAMDTIKITDDNSLRIFKGNKNIIILPTKTTGEPLFDTSNVTDMRGMFHSCSRLVNANLSSFDTSNVTDMYNMFNYCTSLTSLDLSSFDTSNVTDMGWMFYYCTSLTSLDLSSFDTSNVTDMHGMFYNCTSLTSLDLSSFDTSNVTDTSSMFAGVPANCKILVADEAMKEWVLGVRSNLTNVQIKENA